MKKSIIVLIALFLGACNAQDIATSISTSSQTIKDKVASVQSYARQICSYVPTAGTVISIFSSGMGTDVAVVANAICNAVTTQPLADGPGGRAHYVNGVAIHGKFVK